MAALDGNSTLQQMAWAETCEDYAYAIGGMKASTVRLVAHRVVEKYARLDQNIAALTNGIEENNYDR